MNICIPVKSTRPPFAVSDWKTASCYCLMNKSGEQQSLIVREDLEKEIAASSINHVLEQKSIGYVLCPSMPVMTKRIFSGSGVEVVYTDAETLEEAFKTWKAGQEKAPPQSFHFTTGCASSCSSCDSGCK